VKLAIYGDEHLTPETNRIIIKTPHRPREIRSDKEYQLVLLTA
jgi:hypothetical protein